VPDLIRAFAITLRDAPAARLTIVGENRTFPHQDLDAARRDAGVAAQVTLKAYATDDELAAAYRQASVFVFLSEYEGFGLTPLEALASGIPTVLLDTPVARETCGAAAVYVPADDLAAGAARAMTRLLTDDTHRADMLNRAPEVLARYSWDAAARATMDALESACGASS
jgi:glycosyltransferase involved in cell wall biosynthesis